MCPPIEPPPFPKNANRKPQEPLQIISAAAPKTAEHDDDRDGGGEDTLSATLEEMDISDTEEGSHAELGDLKRLFTEEEDQQQHLVKGEEQNQQLGAHRDLCQEDAAAYSPAQNSSSSNLFYQLHQQAVDYCAQPYLTTSSSNSATPANGYFSWNFMDYCCAAPDGGSDYYNDNNKKNKYQEQHAQEQQLQTHDDSASASAPPVGQAD